MRGNTIYKCVITFILIFITTSGLLNAQSLTATSSASFVVKSDGTLWACGSNEYGVLGDNSNSNQSKFVQVGNDTNWVKVSSHDNRVLGTKKDGTLWYWGYNNYTYQPKKVGADNDWIEAMISLNGDCFAIKKDGTLWAWGNNKYNDGSNTMGRLGDSTLPELTYSPTKIGTDTNWSKIFSAPNAIFAIKKDGSLWGWGSNYANILLTGNKNVVKLPYKLTNTNDWVAISYTNTGCNTVIALKKNGTVWGFGNNPDFINNNVTNFAFNEPIQIGSDSNWKDIQETLLIKKDGTLWSINKIFCGSSIRSITFSNKIKGSDWVFVSSSMGYYSENFLGVKNNGLLYSFGWNKFGQLGIGISGDKYIPTRLGSGLWDFVSVGYGSSIAIKSDSTLWAWGSDFGSKVPKLISSTKDWRILKCGEGFAFGIKYDSTLWAFGTNIYGNLGDSTKSDKSIPIKISKLSKVIDISTSQFIGEVVQGKFIQRTHSIALTADGKLWAWGNNKMGQLGIGDTTERLSPVQIGSDNDWIKVSCNSDYSIAIKKDGTLWTWGRSLIIKDSFSKKPILLSSRKDWKNIYAGSVNALLISNGGALYTFGSNGSGNFGNGEHVWVEFNNITRIGTDSNWNNATAEWYTSVGLKNDGSIWSWGDNSYGALGLNNVTRNQTVPKKISNENDWKLITTGGDINHGASIKNNGSLWLWGNSTDDVLGMNDIIFDSIQNTGFQVFIPKVSNPVLTKVEVDSKKVKLTIEKSFASTLAKINIYKSLSPISDTSTIKEYATLNSIDSISFTDSFNVVSGTKYFYRVKNIYSDNSKSDFSNELYTLLISSPNLLSPVNRSLKNDTTIVFKWSKADFATNYVLELGTDSLFANTTIRKNVKDTLGTIGTLDFNKDYYWRVAAADTFNISPWSKFSTFQTILQKPKLDSVNPVLRTLMLKWSNVDTAKIKFIKIYRDTIALPTKLIDSISGKLLQYNDNLNIQVNQKYFYRLIAVNNALVESDFSNVISGTPFNTLPKATKLIDKEIKNVGEYNFVKLTYSASGTKDPDGTISKYLWYVNDSLVNQTDTVFSFFFKLGTNKIKLVVIDNDNGRDSSIATVKLISLTKKFKAGILGGISALNQNTIITADSSYDPILGSSIVVLDRNANTILPLTVQSKIFTTPSISSDSLIFITNGSN